jgi:hypothetical protein
MSFSAYKALEDALEQLQVEGGLEQFVEPVTHTPEDFLANWLRETRDLGYDRSEAGRVESLVFPILRDVWRHYRGVIHIWRGPTFGSAPLTGEPDFVLARTNVVGPFRLLPPFGAIVEAKQEKFGEGWGQCLAAMVAAQRLNKTPHLTVFGIVTTGLDWEFAKLTGSTFRQDPRVFPMSDLVQLCGAVRYVFEAISHYPVLAPLGREQAA